MKKSTNVTSAITSNVRPDTKMNDALTIFLSLPADENKRKACITRFKHELDMKDRTASTYYQLCVDKLLKLQEPETETALESKLKRKFSSVKTVRGGDIAAHVALFTSKAAAEEFNNKLPGFVTYPGIINEGDRVKYVA